MKYYLITNNSAYKFSDDVESYLESGYELYGLPFVNGDYYCQAVIKKG